MGGLLNWLRGGSDELGWDDVIARVVEQVAGLARYAERGRLSFPPEVTVRITVASGSVEVVRQFTERPEFDQQVAAGLTNRCDCDALDLPLREYLVSPADRTTVTVTEGVAKVWELLVEGGDRAGQAIRLPAGAAEVRFGRGEWHGPERQIRNDAIVADRTEFVSRRAGRLLRTGHHFEVEALDQADGLVVRRAAGEAIRPARTARGRVLVRAGDAIELEDPQGHTLRLVLRRAPA